VCGIFDEVDAFVLGRKTYKIFAASWLKATDPDDPIAIRWCSARASGCSPKG
jgi:hypothetical protein